MNWPDAVVTMAKWYETNIHTYQGTTAKPRKPCTEFDCNLLQKRGKIRDDCCGFVTACLNYFGEQNSNDNLSKIIYGCDQFVKLGNEKNDKYVDALTNNGFIYLPFKKDILQKFDIYTLSKTNSSSGHGHTEICAGENQQYGWGAIHDGQDGRGGMPCGWSSGKAYESILRHELLNNLSKEEIERLQGEVQNGTANSSPTGSYVTGPYTSVKAPYTEVKWEPPIQGGSIAMQDSISKTGKLGMILGVHIRQKNIYGRKTAKQLVEEEDKKEDKD